MPYLKRKTPLESSESSSASGTSAKKNGSKSGSKPSAKSGAKSGGKKYGPKPKKPTRPATPEFDTADMPAEKLSTTNVTPTTKPSAPQQGQNKKPAPVMVTLSIPEGFDALKDLDGMARPYTRRVVKDAPPARALALGVLRSIIRDGADLQAALDEALSKGSISRQDASLCTELVYGYCRSEIRNSWLIRQFLKTPSKVPTDVLAILGLAAYEITSLDRIPVYASVDWAVTCIRKSFGDGFSKLANAVLRNLVRQQEANEKDGLTPEAFYASALPELPSRLVIQYSTPPWLVDLWLTSYGEELTENLLKASCSHPASAVRLNASRFNVDAVREDLLLDVAYTMSQDEHESARHSALLDDEAEASSSINEVSPDTEESEASTAPQDQSYVALTQEAIQARIDELGIADLVRPVGQYGLMFARGAMPLHVDGLQKKGLLSRQSGASQGVLLALEPHAWPSPIWDCCCGRGGKTAALMEAGVDVIAASDVSNPRLRGLQKDFLRLCLQQPHFVFRAPAEVTSQALQFAPQTILIDAPCSGLGTLSRRPDIKLRRTEEQIEGLVKTQQRILDTSWARLPVGGYLVYITCTRNLNENQHQIERLLALHPDAVLVREYETPLEDPSNEFFYGAVLRKA